MTARRLVRAAAAVAVLTGPTILAFASGGYFATSRLHAALIVWALVLALALTGPAPLPRTNAGRLAVGGLAGITLWSAVSIAWAPLGGPAVESVQRLVLYSGALLLAIGALRSGAALRAVEPALAGGAALVIGYGLAGRLLPDLVTLDRSVSAGGRLEQPITYWNGEGALAAVGLLLCARLAGDRSRSAALRAAAAAAAVPLAAGLYLTYSRGALAVALLGILVLLAAAPTTMQLRAAVTVLVAGTAASVCVAALPGVAALEGHSLARDGALGLTALVVIACAAALATVRARTPDRPLAWGRLLPVAVAVGLAGVAVGLVVGGLGEKPSAAELSRTADAGRLTNVSSNRYEYWRVGLGAFARDPLTGTGAGGFRGEWLRERSIPEAVRDVHSLELEMAAELGLPGIVAFAVLVVGVALAARAALRRHGPAAAGPVAALLAWTLHASIDWDWQLPAVTLPALVLAGALIVAGEGAATERSGGTRAAGGLSLDPAER